MLDPEINLNELFGDNNMKMQSSTIYRALRGEGMRVTPLVGNKVNAEPQKVVVPSHMVVSNLKQKTPQKPGTASTDRSVTKTTYVGKIFDLRENTTKDGGLKRPSIEYQPPPSGPTTKAPLKAPTTTKVVMEFKKRDVVTPVSATSTQRVPFTSTKLEKQVSRESLKEEESDKKPKPQKKPAGNRISGRKSSLVSKDPPKSRFTAPKARIPSNLPQRLSLYKHRKVMASDKNKTNASVADSGRNTGGYKAAPERPITVQKTVPGSAPKETLKNAQRLPTGSGQKLPPGSSQTLLAKSSLKLQPGNESKIDFPRKTESRKSAGRVKTATTNPQRTVGRKKLWIPTSEAVESWNQFCPASKVKTRRKRRIIKRQPIEFEAVKSVTGRTARSDFDDDTSDESTEIDEEERRRLRKLEIRREMEQKTVEFFNQFKYGEILRKAVPRMCYNSEIRSDKPSDARLSNVEVKMRLSNLNESASRINGLIPKWSSMLMTTKEANRLEQIRKTLTNAQHILERKVDRAKEMLTKYIDESGPAISAEEMEDIKRHSELVQLDMNSLERMFAAHEKQLTDELDEPTSISP